MRAVVGGAGRDVDRDVADQPHAALGRVRAQRAPLALEAHLVGERAAAGEARPVLDPAGLALAEVELLVPADRRVPARPAAPARRRTPSAPCTASRSGPAGRAAASATTTGRPAASQSTHAYASRPSRPPGSEVGCSCTPLTTAGRSTAGRVRADVCARGYRILRARDAKARRRPADPDPVPAARRSTPAGTRPSAPSATSSRSSADVFRDGHDKLRAVVALPRRRRAQVARGRAAPARRRTSTACAGAARSPSTAPGRWEYTIEAWTDVFATWRDELRRKVEAGPARPRGRAQRGRACCSQDVAERAKGADRKLIEHALRVLDRRRDPRGRQARRRARHRAVRRGRAQRRAPRRRRGWSRRWRSRSTAFARASAPGTSCSRAPGAG